MNTIRQYDKLTRLTIFIDKKVNYKSALGRA